MTCYICGERADRQALYGLQPLCGWCCLAHELLAVPPTHVEDPPPLDAIGEEPTNPRGELPAAVESWLAHSGR